MQTTVSTRYADLNVVLDEFVSGVRNSLAENFCGAYLVGSFALGDADEHSDVDFIVATHGDVTDDELARLQAMHKRLYALESPWAQHLEGSYVPKDALRRVDPSRSPYWFLDNGATELVRDPHCNTAVVRWTLREHGIVLAGSEPKRLVDPVTPDQLHDEALWALEHYASWAREAHDGFKDEHGRGHDMSRWKQPYLVLTFCRLLHTLETGIVASKREGGEWALGALDPEWRPLIQRALDDRPDPWLRIDQPADDEVVARTIAFADYAARVAPRATGSTPPTRAGW